MLQQQSQQDRISKINSTAEELLRTMVAAKQEPEKMSDAERLLAEFMFLIGYAL